MTRTLRSVLLSTAVIASSLIAAPIAFAQDAVEEPGEEIVVTGTRVTGRSRLDTVSPVDVLSAETITEQGTTELSQALSNTLPSLDFPRPAITDGTDSLRPATLRGLAPDQTLVLVNSRRRHASALVNINGSIGRGSAAVDLNAIPTIALQSVEVLRDGASAQYGSDAIAGVINLRLREANSGGGVMITHGQYLTDFQTTRLPDGREERDGATTTVAGWMGVPILEDGFLTISAEYLTRDPTSRGDRDPRITSESQSPTGSLITSRYGDPTLDQGTIYLNAGVPLFGTWEAYSWLGYQHRETDSAANPRLANPNGVPNTAQTVASVTPVGFLPRIAPTIDDKTAAFGVRGELGGWDVDAGIVYGGNRIEYTTENSLNASIARAQTTPGNPLFGQTPQRDFYSGSLEYNQHVANIGFVRTFGAATDTPITLAFGAEYRDEEYKIGAGERSSYDIARDPATGVPIPGIVGAGGAQGFPGLQAADAGSADRDAHSVYAEVEANLTPRLLASMAARYENYSDFGSTLNGKISARYDFTDAFALRGTVSSGFRAPSMQQQAFTSTATNFINGIPVDVLTVTADSPLSAALGGVPLEPEQSVNYSVGAVWRAGDLEVTIDAYRIEITDRIVLSENIQGNATGTPTQQAIFALINPLSPTASAARFFINGVDTETQGIDLVARYAVPYDQFGRFELTLSGNVNSTDVTRTPTTSVLAALPVPPILFPQNRVLEFERGTPEEKVGVAIDWDFAPFGATLRATHYGEVLVPQANLALTFPLAPAMIVDLEGRAEWRDLQFALGANNVLDEYPNMTPTNVNPNGPIAFSSFSPFGFNGRFLYARVSFGW